VWLFNRRAKALRGLESLELNERIFGLWEIKKRISLVSYPNIARQTIGQKIKLRMKYLKHRSAFLVPAFLLRKGDKGNSGHSPSTPSTGALAGNQGSI